MVGGHFRSCAPVDNGYVRGSATKGSARRVEGRIASSHHQHVAAWEYRTAEVEPAQELHPAGDTRHALIGNAELPLHVSPDGDEDRGIALRSEEHTSELQSLRHLVCRLLLEKNQ